MAKKGDRERVLGVKGQNIDKVEISEPGGYEPTALVLHLSDDSALHVSARSVQYDQYSSSSCLGLELVPAGETRR